VFREFIWVQERDVTGQWRRLHDEELYALDSSPNSIQVIKETEIGSAYSTNGGEERFIEGLVGKLEGRRPVERPRRRWVDNIKTDLRRVGWGMKWIDLAQDRERWWAVVNAAMNCRVP
jgi:hypothetical protein